MTLEVVVRSNAHLAASVLNVSSSNMLLVLSSLPFLGFDSLLVGHAP